MSPLGLLMFLYLRFKLKQRDLLMTFFFALTILFCVWEVTELPAILAKFSFMSMTTPLRLRSVIDFMQLAMIFRGLALLKNFPTPFARLLIAEGIAILPVILFGFLIPEWFSVEKIFAMFAFNLLTIFLLLTVQTKKTFVTLIILMLGIGATVNPVNSGVDAIYKQPVGQKIAEIAQAEKSFWLVEGGGVSYNNFPIMFGAPTINSVNVYPVLERWQKLDASGENFKIYNRYAHITATLQNAPTTFSMQPMIANLAEVDLNSADLATLILKYALSHGGENVVADAFTLNLNPADLKTLDVKYIFSRNAELEKFSTNNVKITKIFADAGSFIYAVE